MREKLLVIVGPTAVGKTELSIDTATRFNGEIISGDSMQVYRGMDIGTAKIKQEEMKGIPHYLIDLYEPDKFFSVAEFQDLAAKSISEINAKGKLPIIVGGTGLYIKSVTHRYDFPDAGVDEQYRAELHLLVEKEGREYLHGLLQQIDPKTADRLHTNDVKRIIRALEVYHLAGKPLSELLELQKMETPYDLLIIGLTMDRQKLYARINRRVDKMLEAGLIAEVKNLMNRGYDDKYYSMQGIGYKEIIQHLKGEISLEEAVERIQQGTRRFAKRQLSWFRQMPEVHWFDLTDEDEIARNKIKNNIYRLIAGNFASMKN